MTCNHSKGLKTVKNRLKMVEEMVRHYEELGLGALAPECRKDAYRFYANERATLAWVVKHLTQELGKERP